MKTFIVRGITLLAAVVFVATTTQAQQVEFKEQHPPAPLPQDSTTQRRPAFAKKGSVELGGSIGYSSTTEVYNGKTGSAISTFLIAPQLGYFVSDGVEIGLNPLSIQITSLKNESLTTVHSLMSLSYNGTTGEGMHPFIEGVFGFALQSESTVSSDSRSGISFGGRAGIKYEVTSSVLLNASLQYLQVTLNDDSDKERNGYNTLALGLGFTVSL